MTANTVTNNFLLPAITAVLNGAFPSSTVLPQNNCGLVSPILKKGDPQDPANYRPICVTNPLVRQYARILNTRLVGYLERLHIRSPTQSGFRPGLPTTHQLLAFQHLLSTSRSAKHSVYACFLDLKGAYDRVDREMLWVALHRIAVNGLFLQASRSLYSSSSVVVNICGQSGPSLPSQTGLRQGCPYSPTLFGLMSNGLDRELRTEFQHHGTYFDATGS